MSRIQKIMSMSKKYAWNKVQFDEFNLKRNGGNIW